MTEEQQTLEHQHSAQPTLGLKPWLREDSVDSFLAVWRTRSGSPNGAASGNCAPIKIDDGYPCDLLSRSISGRHGDQLVRGSNANTSLQRSVSGRQREQLLRVPSENTNLHRSISVDRERSPNNLKVHDACAGHSLSAKRWRLPLLALKMARLEPLRLDATDLDRELATAPQTAVGELPNGLHYYVRTCPKPEQQVELRLVLRVGSLDEEDDQLGLAHFVEHAAFIKLRSFDKGELFKFLESIGAQVGADLNAHTGFAETVYNLSVPLKELGRAFQILSEWASGIVIDPSEIDRERNVVVEEWRAGKGCRDRLFREWLSTVLGHTLLAKRLPIGGRGDEDGLHCVRSALPEHLQAFIDRNYRPEVAAVVAVGDFPSHDYVLKLLHEHFASWQRTPVERFRRAPTMVDRAPRLGSVEGESRSTKFLVLTDDELTQADMDIGLLLPPRPWAQTTRGVRERILEDVWFEILQDRLRRLMEDEETPAYSSSYARRNDFEGAPVIEFGVNMDDEQQWDRALEILLVETWRLVLHGAQVQEVACKLKEFEMQLEARHAGRHDVESEDIATALVAHIRSDGATPALMTEEHYLRLSLALLKEIDASAVSAHSAGIGTNSHGLDAQAYVMAPDWITLRLPMVSCMCDTQAVRTVLSRCRSKYEKGLIKPAPDRKRPSADSLFAMATAAAAKHPATIKEESTFEIPSMVGHAPIECGHWILSNGATITWCRTSFDRADEDDIVFRALAPGGTDECSVADERSMFAMDGARVGVANTSAADLQTALHFANLFVDAQTCMMEDCRTLAGSCSQKDLGSLFDLAWLYAKLPRLGAAALARTVRKFEELLHMRERDPTFAFNKCVTRLTKGTGARFQPDTVADLEVLKGRDALQHMANLHQKAFGAPCASEWSFLVAGKLPAESELRALVEAKLGAFDAPAIASLLNADRVETQLQGKTHGRWMRSKSLAVHAKVFATSGHEAVRAGTDDESTTIIFFECAKHELHQPGWSWDAQSAAEETDLARIAACEIAQILLRRKLREEMGAIYTVDVGYDACAPHTKPLALLDTRVSVTYTSAPKDFSRCVEAALEVLREFAKTGPTDADIEGMMEQYRRSVQDGLQRNGFYQNLLMDGLRLARCCGGPGGTALTRASEVPVAHLRGYVGRGLDALGRAQRVVTKESVRLAAKDCFSKNCRHVVVSLLPEQNMLGADDVVMASLAEPPAVPAGHSGCCELQ